MLSGCATAPSGGDGLSRMEQAELQRRERRLQAAPQRVRDARLEVILQRVLVRLGPEAQRLRLHVVDRPEAQADLLGGQAVVLRTGLLAQIRNEDELAFVLAHELAHRRLAHVAARRRGDWDARAAELAADRLAAHTLQQVAYRAAAGRELLGRLLESARNPDARGLIAARIDALPEGPALAAATTDPAFEAALAPYRPAWDERRND